MLVERCVSVGYIITSTYLKFGLVFERFSKLRLSLLFHYLSAFSSGSLWLVCLRLLFWVYKQIARIVTDLDFCQLRLAPAIKWSAVISLWLGLCG